MSVYKLGSKGAEVRRMQGRLAELGIYKGPLDGDFGGGTEAAVRTFQRQSGLAVDGRAGPNTWRALFEEQLPAPALLAQGLANKCLALTGSIETGRAAPECFSRLSGDFDGQGISFGALQWNFGQGTLQPLLQAMMERFPEVAAQVFGAHLDTLRQALAGDKEQLLEFARSVQHPVKHTVFEPWRGYAIALGRTAEFQAIQTEAASGLFRAAQGLCRDYGLWSERAIALMFDIKVQNGTIGAVTRANILADFSRLPGDLDEAQREQARLVIIANRRAEAANPRWVDDVRQRKLCIARGEGVVHGVHYELEHDFGIRLARTDMPN